MSAEVSVDKTFFVQAGLFIASYGVLRGLVFGPYKQLLKARDERSSLLKAAAAKQKEEAAQLKEKYEAFMRSERKKTQGWTDEERKKISEEEKQIVQLARHTSNVKLKEMRTKLAQEGADVRKALAPKMAEYASLLASRIMGRKVVVGARVAQDREEATLS
ncbi:MAG: hypothetical protein HYR96_15130 [Deltaproteobacteria bacterium]|nr:hypothetical protein [Deltaproteobacteria bacterium]MBI3293748.1 hypothetical protein [Deltaproteobacteria bacterium]